MTTTRDWTLLRDAMPQRDAIVETGVGTVLDGCCLARYVALYGPENVRWRPATDEQRAEYEAENARIAALDAERYGPREGDDPSWAPWIEPAREAAREERGQGELFGRDAA